MQSWRWQCSSRGQHMLDVLEVKPEGRLRQCRPVQKRDSRRMTRMDLPSRSQMPLKRAVR